MKRFIKKENIIALYNTLESLKENRNNLLTKNLE